MFARLLLVSGVICAASFATTPLAADSLPRGPGLAATYPGDAGLADDPAVLLYEDFSHGSTEELEARWDSVSNADGRVHAFVEDVPAGSTSRWSLQSTATLGENQGGHLYTRLPEGADVAFARFYVRFAEDAGYLHHFPRLGGYREPTPWPQGTAGRRPPGDERFNVGIQPFARGGRVEPPGSWAFYVYWNEMKASAGGHYWGNGLHPPQPHVPPRGEWQCVEIMIKLNTEPDARDGELALWLDGQLVAHLKQGKPRSHWTGMGFDLLEGEEAEGAEAFEGFRWRTDTDLKINYFWLLHYVTEGALERANVAEPNPIHRVQFDHVVVAREYIGPIVAED